ncbi:MAG TPA: AMP-binding protein, partial [Thermoanaerobaculia bacterium]|nr:AMP-binding protein [Thermoanaerobaculia bacterium]
MALTSMSNLRVLRLVDTLRDRAADGNGFLPAYTYLEDGEAAERTLSWADLDRQARTIAAHLGAVTARGERALLLFPAGLDFIAAFFGCLYAGVVAVPCYPPRPNRGQPRLRAIVRDSRPAVVLTDTALSLKSGALVEEIPELAAARWLATDGLDAAAADDWRDPGGDPDHLAFLQYTSGSTALPKGVMVSHGNLIANERMIQAAFRQSEASVVVGWLPLYHDMGLIGNVLQPLWSGGRCVLMPPVAFLQKPLRWLAAISRYGGTTSGGPNFAYDLCARKIGEEEKAGLDLSSWEVAYNGAEPVRPATLERFAAAFACRGFRSAAFYPCYGLAEATLFAAGGDLPAGPQAASFDAAGLALGQARPAAAGANARELAACGHPWLEQELAIVDPETRRQLPAGEVGEIWIAGPNVAAGYWARPEESAEAFGAYAEDGSGPYLRTGDLGFLAAGELFVAGRRKDLIILRGRNLYPQDLELTAEAAHAALRPGSGAAFSVEREGEERLVLVHELERSANAMVRREGIAAVAAAVRAAIAEEHEAQVADLVLVKLGSVPKTSSGKVQRHACRDAYLAGTLAVIAQSAAGDGSEEDLEHGATAALVLDRGSLAALPAAERTAALEAVLRSLAARALGISAARIARDVPLAAHGLDSLAALDLRTAVEERLGAVVPLATLFEGATLADLATLLAAELAGDRRHRAEVDDRVVKGEQRDVARGRSLEEAHAHQRSAFEVEGP